MIKQIFFLSLTVLILQHPLSGSAMESGSEKAAAEATDKGWRYFEIGEHATALKRFRQATILDPDFAPGYYAVGYMYSLQDRPSLAIQYFHKAVEHDPADPATYTQLGLALMQTGQRPEGLQMLQRALAIDPNHGEAHIGISRYYCSEKNGRLAKVHLEQADNLGIQADPQFVEELITKCP